MRRNLHVSGVRSGRVRAGIASQSSRRNGGSSGSGEVVENETATRAATGGTFAATGGTGGQAANTALACRALRRGPAILVHQVELGFLRVTVPGLCAILLAVIRELSYV